MEGMGASPWMALGGAGLGLLKSEYIDRPKEERQRKLAAETIRYSPWTGMQPGKVEEADPFGQAMQYGFGGMAQGQQMDSASQASELQKAQLEHLKSLQGQPQQSAGISYGGRSGTFGPGNIA